MAAKIISFEKQKPVHWAEAPLPGQVPYSLEKPNLDLEVTSTTTLTDLVGPSSFLLWDLLGLDYEWLRGCPDKWNESASYWELMEYVQTVKVTNDCAERGIKVNVHLNLWKS